MIDTGTVTAPPHIDMADVQHSILFEQRPAGSNKRLYHIQILTVFLCSLVFFMDQTLVTVIVPVLPAVLHTSSNSHQQLNNNNLSSSSAMNNHSVHNLIPTFTTSKSSLGLLFGSKGLVQLAVCPIIGHATDRLGAEMALLIGVAVDIFCTITYMCGNSYVIFFVVRLVHTHTHL